MSDSSGFRFGVDRLLDDSGLREALSDRRVAVLAHPASVTSALDHSVDALVHLGLHITALFGPQHGYRGDKQDNMVESADEIDAVHGVLCGAVLRCGLDIVHTVCGRSV